MSRTPQEAMPGLARGEGSLAQQLAIPACPFLFSESASLGKCAGKVAPVRRIAQLGVNKTRAYSSIPPTLPIRGEFSVLPVSVLTSAYLVWVELSSLSSYVEVPHLLGPQNVTAIGNQVVADIISQVKIRSYW